LIRRVEVGNRPLPVRRFAVTVVGSGTRDVPELTEPLGRHLAERGVDLVTGGGAGVMAGVARAFVAVRPRDGRSVGILPADPERSGHPPPGYPNPWIEITIPTHLPSRGDAGDGPESRNHVVVLTGDVVIALPGGAGTASELRLARKYGRPVILLGWAGSGDDGPVQTSGTPDDVSVPSWPATMDPRDISGLLDAMLADD
jgi:uncharacterized protein (TIGR00725 family)